MILIRYTGSNQATFKIYSPCFAVCGNQLYHLCN